MKKDEVPEYWAGGEREAKSAESGGTGVVIYSREDRGEAFPCVPGRNGYN